MIEIRYTDELNVILDLSKEEAIRLGNVAIGVEHLFLGILRHKNNAAVDIISFFGADLKQLKYDIENIVKNNLPLQSNQKTIYLTEDADRALNRTFLESHSMLHAGNENAAHLLIAIFNISHNSVHIELCKLKIDSNMIKSKLYNDPIPKFGLFEDNGEKNKYDNFDFLDDFFKDNTTLDDDDDDDDKDDENKPLQTSLFDSYSDSSDSPKTDKSNTPVLDNFGYDLTKAARENKLDPIVGRTKEIERLAQILSRRKKNNPVLIGEPGVGKSAIAEGLAIQITERKVSRLLQNKRVIQLDLASIVAGTKYRGQFEERLKSILNEIKRVNNIILFIDEIHTLVGAGSPAGTLDAANMLKPALARGEIQCIGATTLDEFRTSIESDGALERRFQKIIVEPTTVEETINILSNIKPKYEQHHKVIYTPEAIKACVFLTQRYVSDRYLPDKAIDALDEAGARVHVANNVATPKKITDLEKKIEDIKAKQINAPTDEIQKLYDIEDNLQKQIKSETEAWEKENDKNKPLVDEQKVAEVVSMMTNVPVQKIAQNESQQLIKMADELKGKVIGQDDAITKITKAIQRNRAGLKDPNRPIGTFIFLGPTGVGKTQLAKVIAQYLFGSDDNLIRVDMSEYMEKFAVSRLIGAPPGYVGYGEGGQLTELVRRRPYSVVLLDEIEKAHPDIFNLLLQLLDEGTLTDSIGRKVDFKNTIVIMTSNIGSRQVKELGHGIGFSALTNKLQTLDENTKSIIKKSLEQTFAPEFLNRIDDAIMFNMLTIENIHAIIDIELKQLFKRILDLGYEIKLTKKAKTFIAEQGYDVQLGARPLKRAIQHYLEDNIAEAIIRENPKSGSTINVDLNKEKNDVVVKILVKEVGKKKK
ncbi:MAG: ATP-dependent Clp protease ATP-binding subunit [Prevotellaceae bacterium]|jgi:ATP-dependent Clp protease ATP-binding subunit ClpC|nr:ATP-dependent Clp protease ATP-binding subunit [Prevotellaceae bacterium]